MPIRLPIIATTVSQATAHLATKEDLAAVKTGLAQTKAELKADIEEVNLKLDTISNAVAERLDDHERQIAEMKRQLA